MAYNSLKEYWKWRRAKEAEEKEFRALGVDENTIAEIHDFDRIMFNSNERFYKHLNDVGDFYDEIISDESQRETFFRGFKKQFPKFLYYRAKRKGNFYSNISFQC